MLKRITTYQSFTPKITAVVLFLFTLVSVIGVKAQFKETIKITTNDNMLLLGVNDNNRLLQISYGKKIEDQDLLNIPAFRSVEAYPAFGINISTAGLRMTHSDGNMTTDLVYLSHKVTQLDGNTAVTEVVLKDSHYPVQVSIFFKTFRAENIIEQWVQVTHKEKGSLTLYEAASANLAVDASSYFLTYFNGDWTNEFNMYQTGLFPGTNMALDSKQGIRTTQKTSPSFLLSLNKELEEESGEVIGASLAWPGNWQIQFNVSNEKHLQIIAGINPYAGNYQLDANKLFRTPSLIYTFSANGAGEITRRFHRWARNYGMHNGNGDRDVVLNNWETTGMDFNEDKLSSLIHKGGELGFDLFLLDDGWFGNKYPRNTDQAGLGDWDVNKDKLPHGLEYLASETKKSNMKFGLWVEPEMVNPKSELYDKHPDWVLTAPNRQLDLQRNQLVLDLSNPKVQNYIVSFLDKLITENPQIVYLKWDCNRYLSNSWSAFQGKEKQSNLYTDYSWALLNILERFRAKHPGITLMLCASGGGRMDYGTMRYFDEYWPSDNSNGHERVNIQWGTNYFFPSIGFAGHVSEMGRSTSLKFRFDVAMSGKLGMDMQLSHLSKDEQDFSRNAINTYKGIKDIVLHGDLYRLLSPYKHDRTALMYVAEDKKRALLFNYQLQTRNGGDFSTVYMRGIKPDAKYKLTEINKGSYSRFNDYEGKVFTGRFLIEQGLKFSMWGIDESVVVLLTEQD